MRNIRYYLILVLILAVSFDQANAQKVTNVNALKAFSEKKAKEWKQKRAEAEAFAKSRNLPIRKVTKDGLVFELQKIVDGIPQYYTTENFDAAQTISTDQVHTAPYFLQGQNMTVHEWDAGAVLGTHQEFSGRVTQGDGAQTTHYHATHVAGTMIASGVNPAAKGMAPLANLRAFDWNSDDAEMASEAASGALYSNHSYGYRRGWSVVNGQWVWYGNTSISTQEDYLFGFYNSDSRAWDQIAYDAPYYLIVKSAGNDRGDGPTNGQYPQDGPYDCIGTHGIAKNVLTVGAVADINNGYQTPSDVVLASFSSWGPADDGRIKPDIVANGLGLYSTDDDNNSDYTSLSGTSMSTPNVTGSLVLLQEQYQKDNGAGNYMLAATLKALVIATADEAGTANGPDYEYGWGLMNTQSAVDKIIEDQNLNVIDELVLNNGSSYTRLVHSDGNDPIKITICWTDVPGSPVAAQLDPSNAMLVNDLDLKVTIGTQTFYPWRLDRNNPTLPAKNDGKNYVDNVEMIFFQPPGAGDYLITVDHEGSLSGGSQAFSIILDGVNDNVALTADFDIENQLVYLGDTVNFTDKSSGNPESWSWTLTGGDPATSTEQNPTVLYNTIGLYDVTLAITRGSENDNITKPDFIEVLAPFADFEADNTTITEGGSVNFSDLSEGHPETYLWTFEGGNPATSTEQNPTVSYSTIGSYDVTLEFVQAGETYTKTVTDYVTVEEVSYCSLASSSYSDYISNFTVGNINNSSGASNYSDFTGHTFNAVPGNSYTVSITPYKSKRNNRETYRVWIDYNLDGDFYDSGELVFSRDRQRDAVSGTFTIPSNVPSDTRMRVAMALNVSSISPCGTIATGEVEDYTVSFSIPTPPVAAFSGSRTSIEEGESIQFTDESTNNPTSWSWSFPGGTPSTSTAENPTITYNTEGTYSVTLTATNSAGSDIEEKVGYITVSVPTPQPPVAAFSASPTSVVEGGTVQFTDESTNSPTSWAWTFPGGTPSTSTAQNPTVVYNTAGTYDVTLTATNGQGSDGETKTGYITVTVASDYCESSSQSDTDEYISSVQIGNYTNTSGASMYTYYDTPVVTISQGGTYTVTLTPTFNGRAQREFWRIWIDFNQDGDFDDADEQVFVQNNKRSEVTGSITIPGTAPLGYTRMRVTMKRGGSPSSCETFSIGEVEDYQANIVTPKIALGKSNNDISFSMYPNPASDNINLLIKGLEDFEMTIYNSAGELMFDKIGQKGLNEINTSDFPSGVYYIRVRSGLDQFVEKFIKL